MTEVQPFPDGVIESLAKALSESGTNSEINSSLRRCNLPQNLGGYTKWRHLRSVFLELQDRDRSPNGILQFTRALLAPARFVGKNDEYERHRQYVNEVLAFVGLEYRADGQIQKGQQPAKTIVEAESRARNLRTRLQGRQIHGEVMKYCRAEFMQDNYFHAVFEATKGLAQRIREQSGIDGDGAKLVDRVFSVDQPVLAFNSLQTEMERSEHIGFATLLKGCFASIRNPLAHQPKILWHGEDDAADYLTLVSMMHRKLDSSFLTRLKTNP